MRWPPFTPRHRAHVLYVTLFWASILLVALAPIPLNAQDGPSLFLEETLEELADDEEDYDWQQEMEDMEHRLANPINLNTATRQDLEQLPMLSPRLVENILAYIYLHGPMQTLSELMLVDDMDRRTIRLITPFVTVQPVEDRLRMPRLGRLLARSRHELTARVDIPFYTRQGYTTGKYLGDKHYHSLRYALSSGDYLQAGISAEKDAGEPLFALHNGKGYDSYSPYLIIHTPGRLRTLAVGNYRTSFGLGLVMCSDLRLGKTFSLSTAEYRSGGIRRHSSTGEYNYLQGVATTVRLARGLDLSAFYSYRAMDGAVSGDTITSILKTGLHRTSLEVSKKRTFAMQVAGGNLSFDRRGLHVGLTGVYIALSRTYEPSRTSTYARYNLHGQRFWNLGLDYRYSLGRFSLTGEVATGTSGYALINRLRYQPTTDYQLLLVHRLYTHDYWSWFGRSFGEGSSPQNENGWYLALSAAPVAHWRFFASVDAFSFPWWRYRISKSSQGIDLMAKAEFEPSRLCSMYLTFRYKRRERDVTGTGGASTSPTWHHKLRYRLQLTPGRWTLRTTLDYNRFLQQNVDTYTFSPQQGWQATQMLAYGASTQTVSGSAQVTYFHTDDYDSRVYASERGLQGTFYTPSYYGHGLRYSATFRLNLDRLLTRALGSRRPLAFMLLAKIGHTVYHNRTTISSGNDLIPSSHKTDLQLQFRFKL